jgi:hypothetical protein
MTDTENIPDIIVKKIAKVYLIGAAISIWFIVMLALFIMATSASAHNNPANMPIVLKAIQPTAQVSVKAGKTAKTKTKAVKPTPQAKAKVKVLKTEQAHISTYWPPEGGTNCAHYADGDCSSNTASGKNWELGVNKWAACPPEWDFGTKFRLPDGRVFECQDRGGAIVYGYTPSWMPYDGYTFVDLLESSDPHYHFGQVVTIEILK